MLYMWVGELMSSLEISISSGHIKKEEVWVKTEKSKSQTRGCAHEVCRSTQFHLGDCIWDFHDSLVGMLGSGWAIQGQIGARKSWLAYFYENTKTSCRTVLCLSPWVEYTGYCTSIAQHSISTANLCHAWILLYFGSAAVVSTKTWNLLHSRDEGRI